MITMARDLLAEWRCDEAQGHFISRPVAPAGLIAWLGAKGGAVH